MRRLWLALVLAALVLALWPTRSSAVLPEIPSPERYALPNGLQVVLDPVFGRRTVAIVVSVEAGRRDQPAGWTGLAHLTEHLLFQGTPAAPGETVTHLEALGASEILGETSDDWTRYSEVVPAARLERALWLEAERFAHGLDGLDEQSVAEQQRVVDR
jgi:zinc protease